MNKADINPATGQAYAVNPATGHWDDTYWSQVVEPSLKGSSGGGSGDFGVDKILQAYKDRQDQFNKLVGEYNTKNPFVYDDVLANNMAQAKEQLDPYYNQTLNDYMSGVTRTRSRSLEDQNRLLGELQTDTQNYTDRNKQNVTLALDKAKEGASQAGLFNSGAAQQNVGLLQNNNNQTLSDYMTTQARKGTGIQQDTQRTLEDLQREQNIQTRNINQERTAQENILGSNLTTESANKYNFGLKQYLGPVADMASGYNILSGSGLA